jgi:UPF0716 protein FxsA
LALSLAFAEDGRQSPSTNPDPEDRLKAPRLAPFIVLVLIAWPIAEIATFAWVGGRIGVINTVGLVLAAGFAGLILLRVQGLAIARRLQAELVAGRMPAGGMLEAAFVLLAALLLLLPGFLSDVLAFLLLFAPVRRAIIRLIGSRFTITTMDGPARRSADDVIDLDADEFRRHESAGDGSPWSDGPGILPPGERGDGPDRP